MTSALTPVSGFRSTSPSLPLSIWNHRIVALLGIGALGLAIFAIYRRSSATTPIDEASLSLRNVTDLKFNGKPALNECQLLPYDKFAQGIIWFDPKDFQPATGWKEDPVNINSWFGKKALYSHVLRREAPLEFFLPNLPYGKVIDLRFNQIFGSTEVDLNIHQTRGLYRLTKEKNSNKFHIKTEKLPTSTKFPPKMLDTPITTEGGTGLVIHPDKTVSITECPEGKVTILNETSRAVIYLLIVAQYEDDDDKDALVLPFVLDSAKTRELSRVCILDNWWRTFIDVTGKYPPYVRPELLITGLQLECFESY